MAKKEPFWPRWENPQHTRNGLKSAKFGLDSLGTEHKRKLSGRIMSVLAKDWKWILKKGFSRYGGAPVSGTGYALP